MGRKRPFAGDHEGIGRPPAVCQNRGLRHALDRGSQRSNGGGTKMLWIALFAVAHRGRRAGARGERAGRAVRAARRARGARAVRRPSGITGGRDAARGAPGAGPPLPRDVRRGGPRADPRRAHPSRRSCDCCRSRGPGSPPFVLSVALPKAARSRRTSSDLLPLRRRALASGARWRVCLAAPASSGGGGSARSRGSGRPEPARQVPRACARSATRSAASSTPMAKRTRLSLMPRASRSSVVFSK
jgi:hypothetical protein